MIEYAYKIFFNPHKEINMKKLNCILLMMMLVVSNVSFACKMSLMNGSVVRIKAVLESIAANSELKESEIVKIKREASPENFTIVLQDGKTLRYTTSMEPNCKVKVKFIK